jgi:hypothetical protein
VKLAPRAAIAALITTTAAAAVAATLLSSSGPALASQTSPTPAHTQQQVAQQVADLFRFTNIRNNVTILSGAGASSVSMSAATTTGSP